MRNVAKNVINTIATITKLMELVEIIHMCFRPEDAALSKILNSLKSVEAEFEASKGGDCPTGGSSSSKVFHVDNKKLCA